MRSIEMANQKSPQILCFGEALIDRLSALGADASANNQVKDCFGGAPANVACALAKLGIEVGFLGSLGNDQIGTNFRKLMVDHGINISCLQIDPLRPSRIVLVKRDSYGERSFAGFVGNRGNGFADEAIALDLLESNWAAIASNAMWLVVGTIPLAYAESSQTFWWCIEKALKQEIRIAVDINWRPVFWNSDAKPDQAPLKTERELIQPLLEIASLIKLSKEEALWFFNSDNPKFISKSLTNQPDIVITDGPSPIRWLLDGIEGTTEIISSLPVVDTTGAGDAFTAGLLSKILDNQQDLQSSKIKLQNMIRFASSCGAIVCSEAGAIDPQPNRRQVEDFIACYGEV